MRVLERLAAQPKQMPHQKTQRMALRIVLVVIMAIAIVIVMNVAIIANMIMQRQHQ